MNNKRRRSQDEGSADRSLLKKAKFLLRSVTKVLRPLFGTGHEADDENSKDSVTQQEGQRQGNSFGLQQEPEQPNDEIVFPSPQNVGQQSATPKLLFEQPSHTPKLNPRPLFNCNHTPNSTLMITNNPLFETRAADQETWRTGERNTLGGAGSTQPHGRTTKRPLSSCPNSRPPFQLSKGVKRNCEWMQGNQSSMLSAEFRTKFGEGCRIKSPSLQYTPQKFVNVRQNDSQRMNSAATTKTTASQTSLGLLGVHLGAQSQEQGTRGRKNKRLKVETPSWLRQDVNRLSEKIQKRAVQLGQEAPELASSLAPPTQSLASVVPAAGMSSQTNNQNQNQQEEQEQLDNNAASQQQQQLQQQNQSDQQQVTENGVDQSGQLEQSGVGAQQTDTQELGGSTSNAEVDQTVGGSPALSANADNPEVAAQDQNQMDNGIITLEEQEELQELGNQSQSIPLPEDGQRKVIVIEDSASASVSKEGTTHIFGANPSVSLPFTKIQASQLGDTDTPMDIDSSLSPIAKLPTTSLFNTPLLNSISTITTPTPILQFTATTSFGGATSNANNSTPLFNNISSTTPPAPILQFIGGTAFGSANNNNFDSNIFNPFQFGASNPVLSPFFGQQNNGMSWGNGNTTTPNPFSQNTNQFGSQSNNNSQFGSQPASPYSSQQQQFQSSFMTPSQGGMLFSLGKDDKSQSKGLSSRSSKRRYRR